MEKVNHKRKKIDYFKEVFTENYLNKFSSKEDKLKFIAVQFDKLNHYLDYCIMRDKFEIVQQLIEIQDFITKYLKEM